MFDEALIESSKRRRRTGALFCLPLSLALHAAAIAAVLGASLCFVEETPDPPAPVIVGFPQPPRPLGGSSPQPQTGRLRPPTRLRASEAGQPHLPPQTLPEVPVSADLTPPGETDLLQTQGVSGGPPGESNGVDGGVPSQTNREDAIPIGGDVKAPELIFRVEPDYPEAARKTGIQGVVILQAIIGTAGEVEQIQVLKAVDPLLDASAQRAVQQWRYRPATLNKRAVRVLLSVTISFKLQEFSSSA